MGHFVGRETSPLTSMQVAMVMASQFVMMYVWLLFQYYMILAHDQGGESIKFL